MRFSSALLGISLWALINPCFADDSASVRVIVKFKPSFQSSKSINHLMKQSANLPIKKVQPMADNAYAVTFNGQPVQSLGKFDPQEATEKLLSQLKSNPNIVYAVKDRKGYFKPLPKSKLAKKKNIELTHEIQWDEFSGPGGVMLESEPYAEDGAWEITTGESTPEVIVAVLDTGIVDHPSLANNLLRDKEGHIWGWNFADNNNDLSDTTKSYHGTHVSGIIASHGTDDGFDIKGMGPKLKILTLKIPGDKEGMFYESSVINAIQWAVGEHIPGIPDNPYPAKVLNMSFGVDENPGKEIDHCDEALQEAIWTAKKRGAVIIAAAGNDDRWEQYNAPAICNGVFKVASTGPEGTRAFYSNYGPTITLAAPGGDGSDGPTGEILSTVNVDCVYAKSGFDFFQGTSMASPHVAGLAGLIAAVSQSELSPIEIEKILYTTTHKFGESDDPDDSCIGEKPCGHGIINAKNAVYAAKKKFDEFFTGPANHQYSGIQSLFTQQKSMWKPITVANLVANKTIAGHIMKGQDGKIYARASHKTYQFDTSQFSHCEVIGYDGIGCYH